MNDNTDILLLSIIYLVDIILYFVTFSWIILLEKNKCNCSINWKRDFIKYYILFIISIYCLLLIYNIYPNQHSIQIKGFIDIIRIIILLSELVFVCIIFIYIKDLINNKCKCSEISQKDISYLYSTLDIMIFIISLFLAGTLFLYRTFVE